MEDALIAHNDSERTVEGSPLLLRLTESIVSRDSEYFTALEKQLEHKQTHALSTVGFLSGTIAGAFGVIGTYPDPRGGFFFE